MKKQVFLIFFMAIFSLAGFSQTLVTQSTGLMAEPSLTSKRIATVLEGDKVALIEKSGEFWKVTCNMKTGFIHGSCLSNYVDPNKKEMKEPAADKAVTGKSVTTPTVMDSAIIVTGARNLLYYNGRLLTVPELKALLITNPEAKEKWKTRNFLYISGLVLAGTGGGVIGANLGSGNMGMVLLGVGIGGVGLVFAVLSDRAQKAAISIYNQGITGKPGSVSLRMGVAEHGFGLTMSF